MTTLQDGITAFKAGNVEEARKYFAAAIKENPKNENAWGWLYQVSKDDNERILCLRKVLEINPANVQARQLLNKLIPPLKEPVKAESPSYVIPIPKTENPKPNAQRSRNILLGIGAILFVCFICICVFWFYDPPKAPPDYKTMAYIQCQLHVENRLKSPSSADFPASSLVNIKDVGNKVFEIRSYVDAQNSFSALIRTYYFCKIQYIGNEQDDEAEPRYWNLIQLDFIE